MRTTASQLIFQILLTITLFSFWAGFALLVVNQVFYKDLPGYTIGRLCIWELAAIIVAFFIAKLMINKWGNIEFREIEGKRKLIIPLKFGTYFTIYFLIAIVVGIWQFWLFSQQF